jgi:hypothetical protein
MNYLFDAPTLGGYSEETEAITPRVINKHHENSFRNNRFSAL